MTTRKNDNTGLIVREDGEPIDTLIKRLQKIQSAGIEYVGIHENGKMLHCWSEQREENKMGIYLATADIEFDTAAQVNSLDEKEMSLEGFMRMTFRSNGFKAEDRKTRREISREVARLVVDYLEKGLKDTEEL